MHAPQIKFEMQEANDTDIIVPDDFDTVDDAVKYAVLEQG